MIKEYKTLDGQIHLDTTCKQCGAVDSYKIIAETSGPHYARANCAECGTFIKWVKKNLPLRIDRRPKK